MRSTILTPDGIVQEVDDILFCETLERPEALVDFEGNARHDRQHILDSISNFKVYSLGGGGTLEEVAMALVNMKLYEVIPAPLIFVDSTTDNDKDHLWKKLEELLGTLTTEKTIHTGESTVQAKFLQRWIYNICHFVKSYDEAFHIIDDYANDPYAYLKAKEVPESVIQSSYKKTIKRAQQTEIKSPPYIEASIRNV